MGLSPGTSITGFPPGIITGTQYVAEAVSVAAQADSVIAYNNAVSQTPASLVATELGGTTKIAGIYNSADGTFGITGTLTLDALGDPDAVFIFQTNSTLITAGNSNIILTNEAQACNVFWQVGSSATLGTNSAFEGNILALTSVTLNTGASVNGRILAQNGAVTLDTNTVSRATCSVIPDPPPADPEPDTDDTSTSTPPSTSPSSSHSSSGSLTHYGCKDTKALNYEYFAGSDPSLCVYSDPTVLPIIATTSTPNFPNTGFPPQEKNFLKNIMNWLMPVNKNIIFPVTEQKSSSQPFRLRIPTIGVDAEVKSLGLDSLGKMDISKDPIFVTWYNLGPRPGETGNAVIAGHYGWLNNQPAVFDNLYKLKKGERIFIENMSTSADEKGSVITFVVREIQIIGGYQNASEVFNSRDEKSHLNLITCGGIWNEFTQNYSERLVIFADKVD